MTTIEVRAMTRAEFDEAEAIVRYGMRAFVEVSEALLAIRDGRGYRHIGYPSFEAYCQDRWDIRRENADRLIRSAQAAALVNPNGLRPKEAQARELAPLLRVDPELIPEAWREAQDTAPNGKPTAAHVAQVVERRLPRPVPEPDSRPMKPVPLLRYCQDLDTATIVSLILRVAFPDAETALDVTYGNGAFHDGSSHVRVTAHDLLDERAPHGVADFTSLRYSPRSFDVVLFDPPHLADSSAGSIMAQRFGTFQGAGDLMAAIQDGTREAWRLSRLGVVVKVCDHIHDEQLQLESDWVREALGGLRPYEVVHQVRPRALVDPRWEEQLSAYSNGSTYLIFRRDDNRHVRRGPR